MDAVIRERLRRSFARHKTRWSMSLGGVDDITPLVEYHSGAAHVEAVAMFVDESVETVAYAAPADAVLKPAVRAFYYGFTAPNLIALSDAYSACQWDIPPHLWDPRQVAEALLHIAPTWTDISDRRIPGRFPIARYDVGREHARRVPRVVYSSRPSSIEFAPT